MDQKFEGTPQSEIRVEGRRLIRGAVKNDWGSQLVWEISHSNKVVAQLPARADASCDHAQNNPGQYEAVLKMFKYEGYAKDKDGQFTQSKFVDVSNKVTFTV